MKKKQMTITRYKSRNNGIFMHRRNLQSQNSISNQIQQNRIDLILLKMICYIAPRANIMAYPFSSSTRSYRIAILTILFRAYDDWMDRGTIHSS